jgi:hypothetical protein
MELDGSQGSDAFDGLDASEGGDILIESRFQGPPESGNGGYVCGLLAQHLGGVSAAVRLRIPPPLDKALQVRRTETGIALFDDATLVAEARAADVTLALPDPPSFEEAEAASQRYRGFRAHWFPGCFVCGPDRHVGDGLRIFPGPVDDGGLVACTWVPDSSLASPTGRIAPEFLWAALDCPGAFSFPEPPQGVLLLGELRVDLLGDVQVGERCVLVAWEHDHRGRKHHTSTALFGETGACLGIGLATWFEVLEGI